MFEWDETKRIKNLEKHGIDFLDASKLFDGRSIFTFPSPKTDEKRYITVGLLDGRLVTVVWTPRAKNTRIISARRSSNEEKIAYCQLYG